MIGRQFTSKKPGAAKARRKQRSTRIRPPVPC